MASEKVVSAAAEHEMETRAPVGAVPVGILASVEVEYAAEER